jgi:hypothetical protein
VGDLLREDQRGLQRRDQPPPDDEPPPPPPPDEPPDPTNPTGEDPTGDPTGDPTNDPTGDPTARTRPRPDPTNDAARPAEYIVDSNNANNDLNVDFYAPATWVPTSSTPGYYGNNYYYADTLPGQDDGTYFYFYLNSPGAYSVDVWYTAGTNRSDQTPIVAFDANNAEIGFQSINMKTGGKAWTPAGTRVAATTSPPAGTP